MTGVFIAANQSDKKMWRTLPTILRHKLNTVYLTEQSNLQTKQNPDIIVANMDDAKTMHPSQAILIFKEMSKPLGILPEGERTVAVVDASGDNDMLEVVGRSMLPAITCGLSSRDTMTLSSIRTDSAVVTLQRSISCFNGETVEPQEIPLQLVRHIDSFTLMAAAAVYVLTGHINLLRDAKIDLPDTNNYHS